MASWSRTAPSLPSGSSWSSEETTEHIANWYTLYSYSSIARLDGDNFALRIRLYSTKGEYGSYDPPSDAKWSLQVYVNGSSVGYTSQNFDDFTLYFTHTAAAGSTVRLRVTMSDLASNNAYADHTAPALLGPTVYIKVSGAWKQGTPYIKVNGAWKQGQLKFKAGGAWK